MIYVVSQGSGDDYRVEGIFEGPEEVDIKALKRSFEYKSIPPDVPWYDALKAHLENRGFRELETDEIWFTF